MPGALTRWDPFAEFGELRSRFERMLEDFGDGHPREWMPAVDMIRDDGHLVVRADIPGIKPEEISIEVEHGVLHSPASMRRARRRQTSASSAVSAATAPSRGG